MTLAQYWDHYTFLGKLPTYPSPKPTLTFTPHSGENVGLEERWVGSVSQMYNDPNIVIVKPGKALLKG